MNPCRRCGGFVQADGEEDTRCLICGDRPLNVPYPEPMRDAYDRIKCRNCVKKVVPGKGYCQSCLDYMVEWRKKKVRA
jgi:hypothetical protein